MSEFFFPGNVWDSSEQLVDLFPYKREVLERVEVRVCRYEPWNGYLIFPLYVRYKIRSQQEQERIELEIGENLGGDRGFPYVLDNIEGILGVVREGYDDLPVKKVLSRYKLDYYLLNIQNLGKTPADIILVPTPIHMLHLMGLGFDNVLCINSFDSISVGQEGRLFIYGNKIAIVDMLDKILLEQMGKVREIEHFKLDLLKRRPDIKGLRELNKFIYKEDSNGN